MDTLWNIIRDFFVRYVFGGIASNGDFFTDNFLGQAARFDNQGEAYYFSLSNTGLFIPLNGLEDSSDSLISYISFSDWLSTTATIITLIALFIGITMLTIKLFKFVSNAISMR